ncbi:hypothetical protein BHE74_00041997 [Ensete ventricosum]|nr:hypothetical protein BHE74_00041997 [Ensete ventricosum]
MWDPSSFSFSCGVPLLRAILWPCLDDCSLCPTASPGRYVRRDLLVLISKSDASILAFIVQRQLLLDPLLCLPRAASASAPSTTKSFRYISPRSTP